MATTQVDRTGGTPSSIALDRSTGLSASAAMKAPCAVSTTLDIVLSGEQTIDGVLTAESRVLVKDQTDASQNGIYVSSSGLWQRAPDFRNNNDVVTGSRVWVTGGTAGGAKEYGVTTAGPIVIGTTDIAFTATAGANGVDGAGITSATASAPAFVALAEQETNGTNTVTITVPASLAADYTFTLPPANVTVSAFAATLLGDADAATARATLGLTIGTNVQAYDADLAAIAALSTTSTGRSLLAIADAAAGRAILSAAASSHNHSWSDITSGKPTTLAGYGITDGAGVTFNAVGSYAAAAIQSGGAVSAGGNVAGSDLNPPLSGTWRLMWNATITPPDGTVVVLVRIA